MQKKELEKFDESDLKEKIFTIRGLQVMHDRDLADLYGVQTKILNKAVKRNSERFPKSFCFQLTTDEVDSLRFQIGTLEKKRGKHTKYRPNVLTEQGVAMLAGILKSDRIKDIFLGFKILNPYKCLGYKFINWGDNEKSAINSFAKL